MTFDQSSQIDRERRIKKAYRKKALELHPDRNYGNVEETTKLFAEIQSAYEVLSDPQERAWYDSHRSTILRGEGEAPGELYEHNVRVTTSDDLMRMFARFTGQLDFSDSTCGFYSVLRGTFDKLAKEEAMACDWEGLEHVQLPSFGHADDNYEEVVRPFYAAWTSFATKKTFPWMDVYRTTDAPDRRVRRMMEKENKRFRDEGIRLFNDTVRQLVAFVRKRDPRYKSNTQTEAERQKIIRDAATAQAARSRAANRAKMTETEKIADWAKTSEKIDEYNNEIEEKPQQEFECVVCRKVFKSEKQFDAHEKSKKHIKAVQRLQKAMRSEAEALDLDNAVSSATSTPTDGPVGDKTRMSQQEDEDANSVEQIYVDEQVTEAMPSDQFSTDLGYKGPTSDLRAVLDHPSSSARSRKHEYASHERVEERIPGNDRENRNFPDGNEHTFDLENLNHGLAGTDLSGGSDSAHPPQRGKAKEKRAKKAAKKAAAESTNVEVYPGTNICLEN